MKLIKVVAGVVRNGSKFLCVQRGPHKFPYISEKREFPGGKIEEGESPEGALIRELKEELELEVINLSYLITVDHVYPDFRIVMDTFICDTASIEFQLSEHQAGIWLSQDDLVELDWAAADVPIVKALKNV
jgi:8-oxo-dGTP diphosphatase